MFACGYWFLYRLWCVKGWEVAHRIFARKEDVFTNFIVFISCVVCLGLRCSILYHSLLVLYLFICHLLFRFSIFFVSVNISLQQCICIVFIKPILIFFVNIYLQQSTCIMFISWVVGFTLSCCLLLSSYSLLVHFLHCLGFRFFVSLNNFLQQSTFFLIWILGYNLVVLLP